jgi:hypothetical protein
MIQIRDIFQVKFGKIDQAVELFTSPSIPAPAVFPSGHRFEALTDISGNMYTLINEYVAQDMHEYEVMRDELFAEPGFDKWFRQFQLCVEGGRREYYNVEGPYETWSGPRGGGARRRAYKGRSACGRVVKHYGGLLVMRVSKPVSLQTPAAYVPGSYRDRDGSLSAWSFSAAYWLRVEFQCGSNRCSRL